MDRLLLGWPRSQAVRSWRHVGLDFRSTGGCSAVPTCFDCPIERMAEAAHDSTAEVC